jgi:hypothetical protein
VLATLATSATVLLFYLLWLPATACFLMGVLSYRFMIWLADWPGESQPTESYSVLGVSVRFDPKGGGRDSFS